MKITYAQVCMLRNQIADLGEADLLPLLDEEARLGDIIARLHFGDGVFQDLTISKNGWVKRRVLRPPSERKEP